jgi:predicted phosphoribosyltransferase
MGLTKAKVIDEPCLRLKNYVFKDRVDAGRLLAKKLKALIEDNSIILAIPAGGAPVGVVLANELRLPLDLVVVRKIPIPGNPEAGFGAITPDGSIVLNEQLVKALGLTEKEIKAYALKRLKEIEERLKKFRGEKPFPNLNDKNVLIVDDGLASGYTMLAAIKWVKSKNPKKIIVAIPTASLQALNTVSPYVDLIVCLNVRFGNFFAVADAYKTWHDLSDQEVIEFLKRIH